MTTLIKDSPFSVFGQFSKETSAIKTQNLIDFDQVIPSVGEINKQTTSDYVLDSLSDISKNQSLSPEQIAKSREKLINSKFESLSEFYNFSNEKAIKSFLQKNQLLFSILKEIPPQIHNYFGSDQGLSLRVSYEPESLGSSDLLIEILTELSAQEAMPILDKFDEQWWLENMNRVDGKLNITLKFV